VRRLVCSRFSCPFLQQGVQPAWLLWFPGLLARCQCAPGSSRVLPSRHRFPWFSSVATACFSCSPTPNWNHLYKSRNLRLNIIQKSLLSPAPVANCENWNSSSPAPCLSIFTYSSAIASYLCVSHVTHNLVWSDRGFPAKPGYEHWSASG
jgi:hypothetical protein